MFNIFNRRSNHQQNTKPQGTDIKHVLKYFQKYSHFILFYFYLFLEFLLKIYIWELQKQFISIVMLFVMIVKGIFNI